MTTIKKNDHLWTWLPELGVDYSYCDRCKKVENQITGKRMTYKQALAEVEETRKNLGMIKYRDNVYAYKNTGFFIEFNENQKWIVYWDRLSKNSHPDFQEYDQAINYIDKMFE